MSNRLKILGLSLFATFAMSAMAAGAASASPAFHSEVEHTILDVQGESETQVFTTPGGGKVSCEEVTAPETTLTNSEVTEITAAPVYSGDCTVSGESGTFNAHIEFEECDYLFTSTDVENHAPVHVKCPEGQEIHVKATFLGFKIQCITIPDQTPTGGGVVYTEGALTEGKKSITIDATVEGITYTTHSNCGGKAEGYETLHDARYDGEVTVWGTDTTGNKVDIWVE